ncbi:M20/M25/M40 family metallo-hydrolase [Natranaerobius thermophilus]
MGSLISEFDTQEILSFLRTLVEHESPSNNKEITNKLGNYLGQHFQQLGFDIEIIENKDYANHILASWGKGDTNILVLGHIDTVWEAGEIEERPFKIEGDKAYGPGVCDMKGGIAQGYFAAKKALDRGLSAQEKSINFLFTSDEEAGSLSSQSIIEKKAQNADVVLVLEPPVSPHGALRYRYV